MEHLELLVCAYHRRNTNIADSYRNGLTTVVKRHCGRVNLDLIWCTGRDLNCYQGLLLVLREGSPQVKLVKVR